MIPVAWSVVAALFAQIVSETPPYPPPGQLVDVGGWRLHLHCSGEARPSQPTVILEAGIGDFSVEWSLVQPKAAAFARVCSYDRAGDGWSELGPHPRTLRQVVYELHTLLGKAGVRRPYVLVGHSYGAWPVRLFASTYRAEVAGMVLVEGGFDNPWRRRSKPTGACRGAGTWSADSAGEDIGSTARERHPAGCTRPDESGRGKGRSARQRTAARQASA